VHYGIGVVVVVFVDNAPGASKNDQRTRFKGARSVLPCNPSFAEVARVFGAQGLRTTQNISIRPCKRRSRPGSRQ
jgi:thiamine pyrophosphate-dependent acetolactate synthase large subunit-like protein